MEEYGARTYRSGKMRAGGYVLVEVIASIVIFSIGMVAVMRAFSVVAQARGVAQDYTVANLLCQKLLSEVRAVPQGLKGGEQQKGDAKRQGTFGPAFEKFRWEMVVKEEQPLTPEKQQGPQPQQPKKISSKRRRTKKARKEEDAELQKRIKLQEVTVTVGWKRRGVDYDVSATALVPKEETAATGLTPGGGGRQGTEGGLRDGVMDHGKRPLGVGALGNVGA